MKALVFHGRGSSPDKINWLIRPFREAGLEVIAPTISEVDDGLEIGAQVMRDSQGELVVSGHSMGGTVALLLAARMPSKVRCAIVVSAPVDRLLQLKYLEEGADGTPRRAIYEELRRKYPRDDYFIQTSPINYINDDTPPILYIWGTADEIVPRNQLTAIEAKARRFAKVVVNGMGHTPRSQHLREISSAIRQFLNDQCNQPSP